MSRWDTIERNHPELAARCRRAFDANLHKVMATLKIDGSPRTSGTELSFLGGDLWLGSMPRARKLEDLRRDPRVSIHSAPTDATMKDGDAKADGIAIEADGARWSELTGQPIPQPGAGFFTIDVTSLTLTTVEGAFLVVESWSEHRGYRKVRRS